MYDVAVFGSINLDVTAMCDEYPHGGDSVFVKSVGMAPGGKGNNQAAAANKQGARVAFVGAVGQDAQGTQMLDNLRAAGIETSRILVDPNHATGTAVCIVDGNGENTILVANGVNLEIPAAHVTKSLADVDAKVLLVQMETSRESILEALRMGREKGMLVVLDPAPADGFFPEALQYADLVLPNKQETERITGIAVHTQEDALAAARKIEELGVARSVVKMGGGGCLVYENGQATFVPAMQVKAVDTVGAGDTFAGGLAAEYARTSDLVASVRYGTVTAGLKVAAGSGHASIPTQEKVREVLATIEW